MMLYVAYVILCCLIQKLSLFSPILAKGYIQSIMTSTLTVLSIFKNLYLKLIAL